MSTDIVVYGASGFGEQVMFWVTDAQEDGAPWNAIGFVDDDEATHGTDRNGLPVLGGHAWLESRAAQGRVGAVLGVADPAVKRRIARRLEGSGIEFPAVTHPSAVLSRHVSVAPGALVGAGSVVSVNVTLGAHTLVNHACTIAHDVTLGDYASVLPGTNVSGNVVIGAGVTLGTNSAVVQGVRIGPGAVVGAGSTVLADLPADSTAVGSPARVVKDRAGLGEPF